MNWVRDSERYVWPIYIILESLDGNKRGPDPGGSYSRAITVALAEASRCFSSLAQESLAQLSNYLASSIDLKGRINCSAGQGNLHLDSELKSFSRYRKRDTTGERKRKSAASSPGGYGWIGRIEPAKASLLLLNGSGRVTKTLAFVAVSHLSTVYPSSGKDSRTIVGPATARCWPRRPNFPPSSTSVPFPSSVSHPGQDFPPANFHLNAPS